MSDQISYIMIEHIGNKDGILHWHPRTFHLDHSRGTALAMIYIFLIRPALYWLVTYSRIEKKGHSGLEIYCLLTMKSFGGL